MLEGKKVSSFLRRVAGVLPDLNKLFFLHLLALPEVKCRKIRKKNVAS